MMDYQRTITSLQKPLVNPSRNQQSISARRVTEN